MTNVIYTSYGRVKLAVWSAPFFTRAFPDEVFGDSSLVAFGQAKGFYFGSSGSLDAR
jgi:hypothetical protein